MKREPMPPRSVAMRLAAAENEVDSLRARLALAEEVVDAARLAKVTLQQVCDVLDPQYDDESGYPLGWTKIDRMEAEIAFDRVRATLNDYDAAKEG